MEMARSWNTHNRSYIASQNLFILEYRLQYKSQGI